MNTIKYNNILFVIVLLFSARTYSCNTQNLKKVNKKISSESVIEKIKNNCKSIELKSNSLNQDKVNYSINRAQNLLFILDLIEQINIASNGIININHFKEVMKQLKIDINLFKSIKHFRINNFEPKGERFYLGVEIKDNTMIIVDMYWDKSINKVEYKSIQLKSNLLKNIDQPIYLPVLDNDKAYLKVEDLYTLRHTDTLLIGIFTSIKKESISHLKLILNKNKLNKSKPNKSKTNKNNLSEHNVLTSQNQGCVVIDTHVAPFLRTSPKYEDNKVDENRYSNGDIFILIKEVHIDTTIWIHVVDTKNNKSEGYFNKSVARKIKCIDQ